MQLRNSQRSCFKDCRKKYEYDYIVGLRPKIPSRKLHLGTLVHEALAYYYNPANMLSLSAENALALYKDRTHQELIKLQLPQDMLAEFEKDKELGYNMLKYYFEEFAPENDDFEVLSVEQEIQARVKTPTGHASHVLFGGRVDGTVSRQKQNLIMEHKTAASVDTNGLILDEQMSAYMWGSREMGMQIDGVIYNILRKVNPYSARSKAPYVHREIIYRNETELKNQGKQLYQEAQDIRSCKNFYRTPSRDCNWKCDYRNLCIASLDGSDVDYLIEANYTKEG